MRVKLKMTLGIGFPSAMRRGEMEIEADDDMDPIELQEYAQECLDDWATNYVDTNVEIERMQS